MSVPMIAMLAMSMAQGDPAGAVAGSAKDAEQTMARFAACEVKSTKGRAAALAFSREVEDMPSDYPQRLVKSSCAERGTTLTFKAGLFRFAVFPALYARDYGKAAPIDVASIPTSNYASEFDGAPSEQTLIFRRFGDCVVRSDADASRRLVLSKLYSADETAALQALRPALGRCVAEGQQLRFSRSVVHGAVGEALYKLTAANAATKAG